MIGLAIVAAELWAVRKARPEFGKAFLCAAICTAVNIVGIVSMFTWQDSPLVLGIAARLLDMAIVVFAMRGFSQVAAGYNTDTMPKKFEAAWGVYVGMELLIMFVGMLNPLITIAVLVAQVVNYVFMLTLIYSLSKYV